MFQSLFSTADTKTKYETMNCLLFHIVLGGAYRREIAMSCHGLNPGDTLRACSTSCQSRLHACLRLSLGIEIATLELQGSSKS